MVSIKRSSKRSPTKKHKHKSDRERRSSSRERHSKEARRSEKRTKLVNDGIENRKVSGPKESAFQYIYPFVDIPVPPALEGDAYRAADELMDTLLMRYVPQLSGVLLSHFNISFLQTHGRIDADGAYSIATAGVSCLVWAPRLGMRLEGQIKLSTPSHVSLLVHGIFNASITAAHLPSSEEARSKGKDAEYVWKEHEDAQEEIQMEEGEDTIFNDSEGLHNGDVGERSTGYWMNEKTEEKLGGKDGKVVFTVVGLTVANHMLSVHGSLLRRPFSIPAPTHVPALASTPTSLESARRVRFQEGHQISTFEPYNEEDEESDEDSVPASGAGSMPEVVSGEGAGKKRRSRLGPKKEGETSGSESEGEARREKKKRKKE